MESYKDEPTVRTLFVHVNSRYNSNFVVQWGGCSKFSEPSLQYRRKIELEEGGGLDPYGPAQKHNNLWTICRFILAFDRCCP